MSWLKNLFGTAPAAEVTSRTPTTKELLDVKIAEEESRLSKLHLPLPQLVTEQAHRIFPTFALPPYASFPLTKLRDREATFDAIEETGVYCLIGNQPEELEEAQRLYDSEGISKVVETFPGGRWLNRNPYGLFKAISGRSIDSDLVNEPNRWKIPALFPLESEPIVQALRQLDTRLDFFYGIVGGLGESDDLTSWEEDLFVQKWKPYEESFIRGEHKPVPRWLLNTILLHLPLPDRHVSMPDTSTTFKVLPSGPIRPAQAIGFLESLHGLTYPVRFSIVQDQGVIFYTLTCHVNDAPTIQRQLALHFPNFTVEEGIDDPSIEWPTRGLYSLWTEPYMIWEFFRTLSDFQVDPHQALLSVLDELPEETTSVEVTFVPVDTQALTTMAEMLSGWHKEYNQEEAGERAKLIAQKIPAWFMDVKLISTKPEHITRVNEIFLQSLHTFKQRFCPRNASPLTEAASRTRKLPLSLISTGELAALVHFPTFEL